MSSGQDRLQSRVNRAGEELLAAHGYVSAIDMLQRIGWLERGIRLAACFVMPPLLFLRTVAPVLAKRRHLGWVTASLPMIGVLVVCRAAGALVGFIRGAGDSPRQIR